MTLQQLAAQIKKKDPTDAPTYAEMLALIEILERMQMPAEMIAHGPIEKFAYSSEEKTAIHVNVNPRSHTYQSGRGDGLVL